MNDQCPFVVWQNRALCRFSERETASETYTQSLPLESKQTSGLDMKINNSNRKVNGML